MPRRRRPRAPRAGADHDDVVLRRERLGSEAEQLGNPPKLRSRHGLPVDNANDRPVVLFRERTAPGLRDVGIVGVQPLERDLISIEKAP